MIRPTNRMPSAPAQSLPTQAGSHPAEDTSEGCRNRASADLASALAMDTEHGRLRMERSAESWTRRAALLEGEGQESHRTILRAEWEAGERPAPTPTRPAAPDDVSARGSARR